MEFEKFRRNWSENELNETLFTKAFETQHNAFLWVALWVVSHFNYEICERFAPIFLRRTHVN
ncbi:hypothetical protein [Leptospira noguchii]|uniref:Uncharacterized protein n=1 Tax=Leptospira noguchii TaxID=28182 RepID=A0AAE9GJF8_9LEPT|nr:hypothetical protein [Leptospira noguchii]UOG58282.1 hypothetical protein MAL03_07210 [Leptospira noguchii]